MSVHALTPDTIVDRRYRVVNRIGSGGMADVYCAQDLQLGRRVALKLLHRRFAEDEAFVERFRREASAAAGLQHPHVVQVFDRGEWDGTYYIAMEFLPGRSLKEAVRDEGAFDPDYAVEIALGVLKALRFAHRRGIVHRDIKPHNVMLDAEGRVKVTDFGIARAGASDMTETGSIMGTAQYLSPEQAQGHAVDARSDLYSVGILLYELLCGRVPFEGESAVTIALKQVSEEPVPPSRLNPRVPPRLEDVVLCALAKDPARRFADADAFISALEAVRRAPAGRDATRVVPTTGTYPAVPVVAEDPVAYVEAGDRGGRRRLWWLLALLVVAGVAVAAYLTLTPTRDEVPNVVGRQADTAAQILQNAGFQVNIETVQSDTVRKNRVATQRPQPQELAEEGSTVTIVVSSGPGEASIPDVIGDPADRATRRVRQAGFRVDVERVFSDEVRRGRIIDTRPEGRTLLERGRTVVLVASRGPERAAVPELEGLSQEDAEAALREAELQPAVSEQETDEVEPGVVVAQDPEPGTRLELGSAVAITVAVAPPEVEVPDVVGSTINDAVDLLTGEGLAVRQTNEPVETTDEEGIVLAQDPPAGTAVEPGTRIAVTVGEFTPPDNLDPDATDPGTTDGGTTDGGAAPDPIVPDGSVP